MSSTMKWTIGAVVVIVILLGLWWGGVFGGSAAAPSTANQPAAAATAVGSSNTAVTSGLVGIDSQIQANDATLTTLAKTPSQTGEVAIANGLGSISSQMLNLIAPLQASMASAQKAGKSVTAASAALGDVKAKISSVSTIVVSVNKSLSTLKPGNDAANAGVLKAALTQLQSAQAYIHVARTDINTVVQATQ